MTDRERFAEICEREAEVSFTEGVGIGTYAEKRLHRVLKRYVCDEESRFEVPVGRYVADVLTEEGIFEIQTGSFRPMIPKLSYYLQETDLPIHLIHPLFETKTVIRMDRRTGEVLRRRKTHVGGRSIDALSDLFYVGEFLTDPRVTVTLLRIEADEFRYSERVRYRREGAYDADLFPRALVETVLFRTPEDYRRFLPEKTEFTAAEYGALAKLKGRRLYSCLNLFCKLGLLEKTAEGRKYLYHVR